MAVTNYRSPTSNPSNFNVTDPTNIYTSNDSHAVYDDAADSADFGDFGDFGVGAGNQIDGFEVSVEGKYTGAGVGHDVAIKIYSDSASDWGSNESWTITGTSDDTGVVGSSTNLFGNTWQLADLANGTFKIRVYVSWLSGVTSLDIDHVQVRVYYSEASPDINVYDESAVTDAASIFLPKLCLNVYDSSAVTDVPAASIGARINIQPDWVNSLKLGT